MLDQSCCSPNSRGFAATFELLFTKLKDSRIVACRLAILAGQMANFISSCCCNDADVRVRSSFSSLTRTELETQSKTASKSSGYSKTFPVSICTSQGGAFDFGEALDGERQAKSRGSSRWHTKSQYCGLRQWHGAVCVHVDAQGHFDQASGSHVGLTILITLKVGLECPRGDHRA